MVFFEKKNQKTFTASAASSTPCRIVVKAKEHRFLGSFLQERTSFFLAFAFVATPACAAPVGERHLLAHTASAALRDAWHSDGLRITVWYPADEGAREAPIDIGPPGHALFRVSLAAADSPFAAGGKRPVILLSHGFGGSARIMGWFGLRLAADGYVVVGVDHPGNTSMGSMTVPGTVLMWLRADDMRLALQMTEADPAIGPHLDLSRIGAAGFSAGGFTALLLAGARAQPERFAAFCARNPDDGVCRPQAEFPLTAAVRAATLRDPSLAPYVAMAGADHAVPGLRAVVVMAPAIVQGIDPRSLGELSIPVAVVAGDADDVAPPATNAVVVARLVPGARLSAVHGAAHDAFLAPCTDAGRAMVAICNRAETVPGAQAVAQEIAIARAEDLFSRVFAKLQ
jgi:predicted dienelactone hydrolase